MRCPFCNHTKDKVVDSRESKDGDTVRRRRECLECGRRFTTYERIEMISYMVHKKDGTREPFDREKLLGGLFRSCHKRPVPIQKLEEVVDEVEAMLQNRNDREIRSSDIGEHVISRLRELDKVAYVRFASVYRDFADIKEFMAELQGLIKRK
ncbi:transcriptional regulator NrdR [Acidobacteriota bacterium]